MRNLALTSRSYTKSRITLFPSPETSSQLFISLAFSIPRAPRRPPPRHIITTASLPEAEAVTTPSWSSFIRANDESGSKPCRRIDRLWSSHDRLCDIVPPPTPPHRAITDLPMGRILSRTLGGRRRDINATNARFDYDDPMIRNREIRETVT